LNRKLTFGLDFFFVRGTVGCHFTSASADESPTVNIITKPALK